MDKPTAMQYETHKIETIPNSGDVHFLKIFDHFNLGVLKIASNNQITYVNQSACKVFECEASDLTGKFFTEEFPDNLDILRTFSHFKENAQIEKQFGELRKANSRPVTVTFWWSANHADAEEIMLCFQPISSGRPNSKMASQFTMEKIIASLIHEIRNPLGGIVGFSNLLEQDLAHLKYAHNMVLKIKQAADSLEKLIASLTIISREKSSFNLRPVLTQDYFGGLFVSFQNDMQQKKSYVSVVKNFPRNDIIVSINPFSFNVLWDIILHQFFKIVQDKDVIIFKIRQEVNTVGFDIILQPDECNALFAKNGFRIPDINQFLIEKILYEHQGNIYYFNAEDKKPSISVELPPFNYRSTT